MSMEDIDLEFCWRKSELCSLTLTWPSTALAAEVLHQWGSWYPERGLRPGFMGKVSGPRWKNGEDQSPDALVFQKQALKPWNGLKGFKDTERTWVSVALTRTWLQMGLEWDSWARCLGRHSWFLESIWEIPSSHSGGRERNPLEWNTNNDQGKTEHRKKRERKCWFPFTE